MSTAAVKRYSVEEYLALERASRDVKHEFFDGEIFAMAGASSPHNLIALNIASELRNALKSRDCLVYPSDMRVQCPTGLYTYPDVSVVCGGPKFAEDRDDTLLNPLVIIEVLSPSTEAYDRGRKYDHYRTIESLREYVLVAQDRASIHHLSRQNDGGWVLNSITEIDGELILPALDVAVPMAEVYAKVEFPPEELLPEGSTMGEPAK